MRAVGSGTAAAFTYDLATSVVTTRQGNPAWATQERDGFAPMRPNDKFFGNAAADPQPDWIDLTKVAIPQADEQQRLLANLIMHVNPTKKPLPRFWYFPHGKKAVVIMTGDDHANGGTAGRFEAVQGEQPGRLLGGRLGVRARHVVHLHRQPSDRGASRRLHGRRFRGRTAHRTRLHQLQHQRRCKRPMPASSPIGRPSTAAWRRRARSAITASSGATGARPRRRS